MTSLPDAPSSLKGLVLLTRRRAEGGLEVRANEDPALLDLKWHEGSAWRPDRHPMPYSRGLAIAISTTEFTFSRYHYGFLDGFQRPAASESHFRIDRKALLQGNARRVIQILDQALLAESRFEGHGACLSTRARSRAFARRLNGAAFSRRLEDVCVGKPIVLRAGRRPELVSELLADWLLARLPYLPPGVYSSINFSYREELKLQSLPFFAQDHAGEAGIGIEAFFQSRRRFMSGHATQRVVHPAPPANLDRELPPVSCLGVPPARS